MRKIEEQMIAAIQRMQAQITWSAIGWQKDNTQVTVSTREDGARITSVFLHGNLIAQTGKDGKWGFCLCGWNTQTTRSRINAIIKGCTDNSCRGAGVVQKKGQPVLSWRKFGGLVYEWQPLPTNAWFWLPD